MKATTQVNHVQELINGWESLATKYARQSDTTYRKLRTGELPQEDEIIYSVYSDDATASTYRNCAEQLKEALKKNG